MVARAEAAFGQVDAFFSHAGIIVPGGIDVPDSTWTRIWTNTQSHIYAARAVLPGMLARGEGDLLVTRAEHSGVGYTKLFRSPTCAG